jgi:hypothetical protein
MASARFTRGRTLAGTTLVPLAELDHSGQSAEIVVLFARVQSPSSFHCPGTALLPLGAKKLVARGDIDAREQSVS